MNTLEIAQEVIETEILGLYNLSKNLCPEFSKSVDAILTSNGKAIICGMGKSGLIGKKIAASFASTGTSSFFMHPGEAIHGDLGMVMPDDIFIAISNSGETDEVIKLLPYLRDNKNIIIAMTGNPESTLAKSANYHLNVAVPKEACHLQLAPTSSTTATLVMGDALTVALMKKRDFQPENFARFHPGGSLGRKLLGRVSDFVIQDKLPIISTEENMTNIIHSISKGGLGIVIVMVNEQVEAIITDGDIRRAMDKYGEKTFNLVASDIATKSPLFINSNLRFEKAIEIMDSHQVNSLLVENQGRFVGIIKK